MHFRIIFSLLMSLVLSFFMTLWVTWLNLGYSDMFFDHWFQAFQYAWPAAAVISFLCGPHIQSLTERIYTKFQ